MKLVDEIMQRIKDEVSDDPAGRGYDGKTDSEIMSLLNEPYEVELIVKEIRPARIHEILIGIASSPNVIKVEDVVSVKAMPIKEVPNG